MYLLWSCSLRDPGKLLIGLYDSYCMRALGSHATNDALHHLVVLAYFKYGVNVCI